MDLALTNNSSPCGKPSRSCSAPSLRPARVRAAEVAGFDERLWRLHAGNGALGIGVPPHRRAAS